MVVNLKNKKQEKRMGAEKELQKKKSPQWYNK